jgi:hypothetical protein
MGADSKLILLVGKLAHVC